MLRPRMILRIALLTLILVAPVYAQTTDYLVDLDASSVHVDGTSNNTPEWRVYATEFEGKVTVAANDATAIESAHLTFPVRMLKSRKSPIMDRGMYQALMADQHPSISFELTGLADMADGEGSAFSVTALGNMTIGPETREVSIPVDGSVDDGGTLRLTGSLTILMTDYGLKPPSMMFGSLRVGNEVVVTAELVARAAS